MTVQENSDSKALPAGPDRQILDFVAAAFPATIDAGTRYTRLTGGVASDIWLVEGRGLSFCVKRALAKLRVASDWFAPIERNANEAAWLRAAGDILPRAVPRLLAEDKAVGVFAMEYCPPENHANWKARLLAGDADADFATQVGSDLARIHAETAKWPELRETFRSDDIFMAIRLEPYLLTTAKAHLDLAGVLEGLVATTIATKKALVHGDVSPKNIMIGPSGPVFLDAECAWWGDPAFDAAFCLNHMLLKCLARPDATPRYLASFAALAERYLAGVTWEDPAAFEARAAALLPGLFLARIDGKSPVEYVTAARDKDSVRRVARMLLASPPSKLIAVAEAWRAELDNRKT